MSNDQIAADVEAFFGGIKDSAESKLSDLERSLTVLYGPSYSLVVQLAAALGELDADSLAALVWGGTPEWHTGWDSAKGDDSHRGLYSSIMAMQGLNGVEWSPEVEKSLVAAQSAADDSGLTEQVANAKEALSGQIFRQGYGEYVPFLHLVALGAVTEHLAFSADSDGKYTKSDYFTLIKPFDRVTKHVHGELHQPH